MRRGMKQMMRYLAMILATAMVLTAFPADVPAKEDTSSPAVSYDVDAAEEEVSGPAAEEEVSEPATEDEKSGPEETQDPEVQEEEKEESEPADNEGDDDEGSPDDAKQEEAPEKSDDDTNINEEEKEEKTEENTDEIIEEKPEETVEEEAEKQEDEVPEKALDVELTEDALAEDVLEADETAVTVTIYANGGKFKDGKATQTWTGDEGDYLSLDDYSSILDRSGYLLMGWAETPNGEAIYEVNDYLSITKSKSLYAVWTKKITVKLDANGGKFSDNETVKTWTNFDGYYNKTLYTGSYGELTRDGYVQEGWSTSKNGELEYRRYDSFEPTKDMTLYAVWLKIVTVKLDANGGKFGDGSSTKTWKRSEYDTTLYLSNYMDAAKSGYKLTGWSKKKGGEVVYDPWVSIDPTDDMTLYAVWGKLVTVRLHAGAGSFPASAADTDHKLSDKNKTLTFKVEKGKSLYLYDSILPTHKSKGLLGWSRSSKAKEPDQGLTHIVGVEILKDTDLYAVWETGYTVTFKTTKYYFDYACTQQTLKVKVPKGAVLSSYAPGVYTPKATEKRVDNIKWSTSSKASAQSTFSARDYKVTSNVTVYPVVSEVTITWNANGGTVYGQSSYNKNYEYAATVTMSGVPEKAGYAFVGWSSNKNETGLIDLRNMHAVKKRTFYAIWKKNAYKIEVKANGGEFASVGSGGALSLDGKKFTAYIEKGQPLSKVPGFEYMKGGEIIPYKCLSLKKNGSPIDNMSSYYPKGNMTLYVIEKGLTVTYNGNGGTETETSMSTTVTEHYAKGEYFDELVFSRPGYFFKGWYTKKSGGTHVKHTTKITKSMTVYARWKKAVKVTFDANGGTFEKNMYLTKRSVTVAKGSTLHSVYNGFSNIPYSTDNNKGFLGWSKKKNGKVVDLAKLKISKNKTLYAVWGKGNDLGDGRLDLGGKRYKYTGKAVKPKVAVYDRNGKKLSAANYKVHYSDNTTVGYGTVTVTGKGKYSGMLRASFEIVYDKTSDVKSATVSKKNIKVTYTKAKNAAAYNTYAVNRDTGRTYVALSRNLSVTLTGLEKGTYLIYVLPQVEKKIDKNNKDTGLSIKAGKVVEKTVK